MFARFERRNRHRRMHIRRRADPDNVELGQREEVGPIPHRRRRRIMFLAKLFAALVSGIRNGDDLDVGMFFQRRQMPITHNVSLPQRSRPAPSDYSFASLLQMQLSILHTRHELRELRLTIAHILRSTISLTIPTRAARFAPFSEAYVESLHHHRFPRHARQHYSPPRYGQEKGGVGRHVTKNVPRFFRPICTNTASGCRS